MTYAGVVGAGGCSRARRGLRRAPSSERRVDRTTRVRRIDVAEPSTSRPPASAAGSGDQRSGVTTASRHVRNARQPRRRVRRVERQRRRRRPSARRAARRAPASARGVPPPASPARTAYRRDRRGGRRRSARGGAPAALARASSSRVAERRLAGPTASASPRRVRGRLRREQLPCTGTPHRQLGRRRSGPPSEQPLRARRASSSGSSPSGRSGRAAAGSSAGRVDAPAAAPSCAASKRSVAYSSVDVEPAVRLAEGQREVELASVDVADARARSTLPHGAASGAAPSARAGRRTSPGTAACGSGCARAAAPRPAARTAGPGARTRRARSRAPAAAARGSVGSPDEVGAQHQRVDEEADQPLGLRPRRARRRRADDEVAPARCSGRAAPGTRRAAP